MVKLAKTVFEKKLCDDINVSPKHFWSFVCSRTELKEKILKVKKSNENLTSRDTETAIEFNKAFRSVFVVEDISNVTTPDLSYNESELTQIEVAEDEVKKLLKDINEYKAVRPDGVPLKFLKECSEELTKPIAMIIRSLDTGQVPTLWKLAQVCQVFKKGSKTDPLNY